MARVARRTIIGGLAAGAVGAALSTGAVRAFAGASLLAGAHSGGVSPLSGAGAPERNPVVAENLLPGSTDWEVGRQGTRATDDTHRQIQGYAAATSVELGDSLDFHVTVADRGDFVVDIYRLGHYSGLGARRIMTTRPMRGVRQSAPRVDHATGLITCEWPVSWRLEVPSEWVSGCYLAVFTAESGWRSATPFVVRDSQRQATVCVVLPFSTYQAYNQWPADGFTGRSLYYGYSPRPMGAATRSASTIPVPGRRDTDQRAVKVSFDRPYGYGQLPRELAHDHDFVRWVESNSYDVTYATSVDLHAGRVDVARYAAIVLCGHDEYWSAPMREITEHAIGVGTSLVFLGANNVYWHIRFEPAGDGRPDRTIVCHKSRGADVDLDRVGPTTQWRLINPQGSFAEQRLVGVQYEGLVSQPAPLVVRSATHWFWRGAGVRDGDRVAGVVIEEADGLDRAIPLPVGADQTLLAASPFRRMQGGTRTQHTSLLRTPAGGIIFAAGTLGWTSALNESRFADDRIRIATANLFDHITQP